MEITIEQEKIIELLSPFAYDEVHERALSRRADAFGTIVKFMQRPKPEEIEITDTERRMEPFWYGAARATYKYDRRNTYHVPVAPEVHDVTFYEQDHAVKDKNFVLEALEHCEELIDRVLMLNPETGAEQDYHKYLSFPKREVEALEALRENDTVVVIPQVRSSFLVGKLTQALMKTIQADQIFEQSIDVEQVVAYYRPVYSFEFLWTTKDKRSTVEFDALTGELHAEPGKMKKQIVRVLDNDDLFDIGADAIGTFVPGANIAVKLGRIAARKALK